MPAGAGWWACDACTDYATGAGDFAEVFAVSQLGPVDYRSEIGPPPDAATLTALAPSSCSRRQPHTAPARPGGRASQREVQPQRVIDLGHERRRNLPDRLADPLDGHRSHLLGLSL